MKLQVGVKIVLVNEDGENLFLRRSQSIDHGGSKVWDIPGGRIKPDEPLMSALAREIREETGLTLEDKPELIVAQDIFVETKDLHVVRLTYRAAASGEVILSEEHDQFVWENLQAFKESGRQIDPYVKELL